MTNAAWWARVPQARTERHDLRPQRMWTLHKGEHGTAIDLKAVPGIAAEIVLTVTASGGRRGSSLPRVGGNWSGRVAHTRAMFEGRGWE